ncbi:MAG: GPR endopeptidase [Oscillospiraceae bacterium]
MAIRTDLAVELYDKGEKKDDAEKSEKFIGNVKVTTLTSQDNKKYTTITVENFTNERAADEAHIAIKGELGKYINTQETVLVIGIGNTAITPDALGPKTAARVLATRHIPQKLVTEVGLTGLRSVAVLSPGVLGQTGVETKEIISALIEKTKPAAVLTIDALAARDIKRLGTTIQITNTGISPGSGVGNRRAEISETTMGVPVIALGVPTVVDAATLVYELTGEENKDINMIVTPSDIDTLIDNASEVIAAAINCALHPEVDEEILLSCI